MNKQTVKSFIRQFAALVKGDTAEQQAEKVFRQAQSAYSSTIATLEGDTVALEDTVTACEEALASARLNNGAMITRREDFIQNVLNRKNELTTAEEALKKHKAKIAFLKEEKSKLEATEQVSAE